MQSFRLPARRRALRIALVLALSLSAWGATSDEEDRPKTQPKYGSQAVRLFP